MERTYKRCHLLYCKGVFQFTLLERPGFKRFLSIMDNWYEVPGQFYFTRTAIPALYATTKYTVKQELSTIKYFTATTDVWYNQGMVPYISYTVHFIDGT